MENNHPHYNKDDTIYIKWKESNEQQSSISERVTIISDAMGVKYLRLAKAA